MEKKNYTNEELIIALSHLNETLSDIFEEFTLDELDDTEKYILGIYGDLVNQITKDEIIKGTIVISACSYERTSQFLKSLSDSDNEEYLKLKVLLSMVGIPNVLDTALGMNVFTYFTEYVEILNQVASTDDIVSLIAVQCRASSALYDEFARLFDLGEYKICIESGDEYGEELNQKVPDARTDIIKLSYKVEDLEESIENLTKKICDETRKLTECRSQITALHKFMQRLENGDKKPWWRK